MIERLVNELKRRELLSSIIDGVIKTHYKLEPNKKLRRGLIQDEILAYLKIQKNNMIVILINERMKAHGFELIINRGNHYYRNITRHSAI